MKKEILDEFLIPLAELTKILENDNLFVTFKNKKWILYSIDNNKLVKITESSTLESLINLYKNGK